MGYGYYRNKEGYYDPTAGAVFAKLDKADRKKRSDRRKAQRKRNAQARKLMANRNQCATILDKDQKEESNDG